MLGITQKQVAASIAVSQSFYSDIEKGRRNLTDKFLDKICSKLPISKAWMLTGQGEIFTPNQGNKTYSFSVPPLYQSKNFIYPTQVRGFKPYDFYNSLSSKDLDFEISIELEKLNDTFEDYRKLKVFLHKVNAPGFLKDKFPVGPDFKTWHKSLVSEFLETHSHIKDEKQLRVLKIVDLYQSSHDHWSLQLSNFINYLYNYADMFNDSSGINKLHKDDS